MSPAAPSLGAGLVAVLGAAFFASLSMTIAGLVLSRERLMGIGQAITMPLFFALRTRLYPVAVMPPWLQALARVNPLSYEVNSAAGAAHRDADEPLARLRRAVDGRRGGHPRGDHRAAAAGALTTDGGPPVVVQAGGSGGAAATSAV